MRSNTDSFFGRGTARIFRGAPTWLAAGRALPPLGTPEELLQYADVQKELKLSSPQLEAINQVTGTLAEKYQREFDKIRSLGPQERRQKQADLVKTISQELAKALAHVLEAGQAGRLEQIYLQRQGLQAFMDPKVERRCGSPRNRKRSSKRSGTTPPRKHVRRFAATLRAISRRSSRRSSRSVGRASKRAWHCLPPSKNKSGMI